MTGVDVVEEIRVPFRGDGSGEAGLTWAQIGIWQAIANSGESRTIGGTSPLPSDFTLDQVTDVIAFIVGRHQSLRTRLTFSGGQPRQVCANSGDIALTVLDAGERDPADLAQQVQEQYQSVPFDYEDEWPMRAAVIRKNGVLTHMVAVYLHLSMDAGGLTALLADLASRDPGTGDAPPVTAVAPLEQARMQREPAHLRQSEAALRYLERVFRAVPVSRFGEPRRAGAAEYRLVRYVSPATRLAVDAVARRAGVGTSPVLLACFAVGLARFTGSSPVLAMLMVSNRFRPAFAESVSTLAQISPYLIDVAGISLGDAVTRAARSTLHAYKHAYYDPDRQDEVVARVNAERGVAVDYSCFYNDRRQSDRVVAAGQDPTEADLHAALARSETHWEHQPGLPRQKLYLNVDDPDDAIELTMSVDTRFFGDDDAVAVLRGIEAVAVDTALNPDTPTGIR